MPIPLTDDAIRELYQRSSNVPEWESWRKRNGAFGPGESVNVDGAYKVPDTVAPARQPEISEWFEPNFLREPGLGALELTPGGAEDVAWLAPVLEALGTPH